MLGEAAEMTPTRHHSEQTAREIDQEIKRIIDQMMEKVRLILEVRREALVALADRLIEIEAVDSTELEEVLRATTSGPVLAPGTKGIPPRRTAKEEPAAGVDDTQKKPETGT
ncbi:MAG: hypothetical protein GX621_14490, partial [Pirellulaceae bacterium]|nr:hypothetical protein [Pirellulaceae bacterium]